MSTAKTTAPTTTSVTAISTITTGTSITAGILVGAFFMERNHKGWYTLHASIMLRCASFAAHLSRNPALKTRACLLRIYCKRLAMLCQCWVVRVCASNLTHLSLNSSNMRIFLQTHDSTCRPRARTQLRHPPRRHPCPCPCGRDNTTCRPRPRTQLRHGRPCPW